jgi:hypothetical protein
MKVTLKALRSFLRIGPLNYEAMDRSPFASQLAPLVAEAKQRQGAGLGSDGEVARKILEACITGCERSPALRHREKECWQVLLHHDVVGMTYDELAAAISPEESARRASQEKFDVRVEPPLAHEQYSSASLRKLRDEGLRLCIQFLSRSPEAVLQDVSRFSEGERGTEALLPSREILVVAGPPRLSRSVKRELADLHGELRTIAEAVAHLGSIKLDRVENIANSELLESAGLEDVHRELLALSAGLRQYASYPPYFGHTARLQALIRELKLTERTTELASLIAELLGLRANTQSGGE